MAKKADVVKELTKCNCAALGLTVHTDWCGCVSFWYEKNGHALFSLIQRTEADGIHLDVKCGLFSCNFDRENNTVATAKIQPLFADFQGVAEIDRNKLKEVFTQVLDVLTSCYKEVQATRRAKLAAEYEAKLAEIDERIANPWFLQE